MNTTLIILVTLTILILISNIVAVKFFKKEDAKVFDFWLIMSIIATVIHLIIN